MDAQEKRYRLAVKARHLADKWGLLARDAAHLISKDPKDPLFAHFGEIACVRDMLNGVAADLALATAKDKEVKA